MEGWKAGCGGVGECMFMQRTEWSDLGLGFISQVKRGEGGGVYLCAGFSS